MAIRDLSGATVLFCKCGVYLRLADSPPVREVLQHEKVLYNADGRNKYYEQCVEEQENPIYRMLKLGFNLLFLVFFELKTRKLSFFSPLKSLRII